MFEAALPGYWMEAVDLIAEDDRVVIRAIMHGVHKGSLMGIPASGKTIKVEGCVIYRIANNKIAETWMLADMPALLEQIGAAPAPATQS